MVNSMKTLMVAVNAKYVHTNIAVRYITQVLKTESMDAEFCEFSINEPCGSVLGKLYEAECTAYGFSCYIWNIEYVMKLCRSLKKLHPDRKIFLGGPEVSFDGEELLEKYPFIDYVVCGEGERTVLELVKSFPEERNVIYPTRTENLDDLPFPYTDADLADTVKGEKLVYYETSRGCPFNCSYCLSSVDKGVRFLNLDRVKSEIRHFAEYGVQTVKFVDRTFNADKKRAAEIWKYCLELDTDTCFHFEIGADLIDDEALEILKKAPLGRFQFEIGIQSTNEKTLSAVCRKMNLKRLGDNIKRLKAETNVMLHVDLIACLPFENFSSFANSFNEAYTMNPHVLQLGFLKLLKGSALRGGADSYGMIYDFFAPYEVYCTNWLTYDDVLRLKAVEDVVERYFNSGRFYGTLDKIIPNFDAPFDFYLKLSEFWKERGLVGQGVKRISLYGLLYEFLVSQLDEERLVPIMREMKKDFSSWHSNGVGTPEWYRKY